MSFAVAQVLSSFGLGGQERVALDLSVGLARAGCRVIAVSLAPGRDEDGPLAAELAARQIGVHTVAKRPGFDVSLPLRLMQLFRRERIEIVHTHNPQPLIYGAPAARLAGARAVHTKHGANPDGGRRLLMRRAAALLVDAYVAVSATTADVARSKREVSAARLVTIPNGIDLSRFHPDDGARRAVRAELGATDDAWLVGTVGRLAPEKDQALLVRAIAPRLDERSRLVIVGDGAEAAALRALAASLPQGRFIHLLGARRDVPRVLAALDLFALSSRTEGLPLSILEAMATALPVVATRVGGVPDVVDEGRTGRLVPPGDETALAEALAALAGDRAGAAALGRAGRALATARYSAERMVDAYLAVYERARAG